MNRFAEAFAEAASGVAPRLRAELIQIPDERKAEIQEIRLRSERPVSVTLPRGSRFILQRGTLTAEPSERTLRSTADEIGETVRLLCEASVYSRQSEISEGFITLSGGHRAGICGTAVYSDGAIKTVRDISSVNIRISRDIKGVSLPMLPHILDGGGRPAGALIISPPGGGKTTVLRDLAYQLSGGSRAAGPFRVAVIDQRGELGAVRLGVPRMELGPLCDILDGYSKADGMQRALRSLSPEVILCDEAGGMDEARAMLECFNAGVPVIATAHAGSMDEIMSRPQGRLLLESGAVLKVIRLCGGASPGKISDIYGIGEIYAAYRGKRHAAFGLRLGGIRNVPKAAPED